MVDLDEFDTPEPDKMDRAIAEGGSVRPNSNPHMARHMRENFALLRLAKTNPDAMACMRREYGRTNRYMQALSSIVHRDRQALSLQEELDTYRRIAIAALYEPTEEEVQP